MTSLRARLTRTLSIAFVVIGALAMTAAYLNARQEVDEMFDFEIKAVALSVDPTVIRSKPPDLPDDDIVVQVWAGALLDYTSDATQIIPRADGAGYVMIRALGGNRVYIRHVGASQIQVAQSLSSRRTLAVEYSLRLLAPLLLMIPLMGAAIWWLTRRMLLPVGRLGAELATRTDGVLDPVDSHGLPDELLPLVSGFNRLLRRLKAAFEAQRSLVADAAHELRTPLAVVQLQAQTLERLVRTDDRHAESASPNAASPPTAPARAAALGAMLEGVGRATRVVQQLLTLARQDATSSAQLDTHVNLTHLVRSTLGELLPLAASKHIDMSFECSDTVLLYGDRGALQALVENLVDNAIKYTPNGGRIGVTLSADGRATRLNVADNGPGIPADQRTLVLDRFYRIPGSAGVGSGLGLAIAAAVVRRHRGQLCLDAAVGGGLAVAVSLPFT